MSCLTPYSTTFNRNAEGIVEAVNKRPGQAESHLNCMTHTGLCISCSSIFCMPYGLFSIPFGIGLTTYSEVKRCSTMDEGRTAKIEDIDIVALSCLKTTCLDPCQTAKSLLACKVTKVDT